MRLRAGSDTLNFKIPLAHHAELVPSPDRLPRGEVYEREWVTADVGQITLDTGRVDLSLELLAADSLESFDMHALILDRDPSNEFADVFSRAGVTGTFVLYDPETRRYRMHDPDRAQTRFIPASTFKIPNSLIALELGIIPDTSTVLEWDGVERSVPAWNRDHSMTSAIRSSVVWFYQELARRTGEDRMREWLRRIGYGNADIGGGIDTFWLTGDLRISALEQIDFLERLRESSLPFSESSMSDVRDILVETRADDFVLRAKTGWASTDSVDVGWYVGYVERADGVHYFALNMDITEPSQQVHRRQIAHDILRDLRLID